MDRLGVSLAHCEPKCTNFYDATEVNLRNFGREQHYSEEQADAKMSRRFVSINLAKPMETVRQNWFPQQTHRARDRQPGCGSGAYGVPTGFRAAELP